MSSVLAALKAVVASLAGFMPAQGSPIHVTMYRSFVPPNATVVNGLFRVDGAMLGTGDSCEYQVGLVVEDSTGTRLVNNQWAGHCPPPQGGVAAGALETFEFAVIPATYTVTVSVESKIGTVGKLVSKSVLTSLPSGVMLSDLILAKKAGWIDPGTEAQYSLRKGDLGIAVASEAVAEEDQPSLAYYVELYPPSDEPLSGTLIGVIRRLDGLRIAELKLQTFDDVAQARPLAGNMSLEGLAAGEYVLEARLDLGDTVVVRTHPFRMAGQTFAQQPVAGPASADMGWFATLTDEKLAELFDPVAVTLTRQSDRDLYSRLNPDGRRRFLVQYFGVTGPASGGQKNPLDLYLERIEHVNRTFSSRLGDEAGWSTDRGRVYLRRGEPQSKVSRPLPPVGAAPYEIWQYTSAPTYAYVFVDESRIGAYRLIWSSDPNESSLPDWDRRLSADAIGDMTRLGIRPTGGGSGGGNGG